MDSAIATTPATDRNGLHLALWAVQGLLAAAFFAAGAWKASAPLDELAAALPWVAEMPTWTARLAGVSEVLGAVGLILPSALRIQPRLTVAAAGGLVAVMVLGVVMHLSLGEPVGASVPATVLGGLAAFVAWGRAVGRPIAAR